MGDHGVKAPAPLLRGRGAQQNPSGRFEKHERAQDAEALDALIEAGEEEAEKQVRTEVFKDASRRVVSTNDSPDVGMEATVNPYRGCEHGCIYCYARPTHEYLGLSAGTDFETKIFVKEDAPALLRKELAARGWVPKTVTLSGITDPYQPLEKTLRVTRGCLEVLRDFRNPAVIITKNAMVTRDVDLLAEMAAYQGIAVSLSITTLDAHVARVMEPRASTPSLRLKAVEALAARGVPVGIMMGPVVPGLTEHEIPAILKAAAEAGARSAHYTMLRLPYGVKDLFEAWAREHFPDRADKMLNRVRSMRGGKLYDAAFGTRMRGTGLHADHIAQMFALYKKQYGLNRGAALSVAGFRVPEEANGQMRLF